jgi:hypothetical protein
MDSPSRKPANPGLMAGLQGPLRDFLLHERVIVNPHDT